MPLRRDAERFVNLDDIAPPAERARKMTVVQQDPALMRRIVSEHSSRGSEMPGELSSLREPSMREPSMREPSMREPSMRSG